MRLVRGYVQFKIGMFLATVFAVGVLVIGNGNPFVALLLAFSLVFVVLAVLFVYSWR